MNIQTLSELLALQLGEVMAIEDATQRILSLVVGKCKNTDLIAVIDRDLKESKLHIEELTTLALAENLTLFDFPGNITKAMERDTMQLLDGELSPLVSDIVITDLAMKLKALELAAYEMAIKTAFLNNLTQLAEELRLMQTQSVKVGGLFSKIIEGYQLLNS